MLNYEGLYAILIFESMNGRSEPKLICYHALSAFVECKKTFVSITKTTLIYAP